MSAPIVVGTDGSAAADRAVDWAAGEAALRHRPLHIVHAAEIWPYQVHRFVPPDAGERTSPAGQAVLLEAESRVLERRPELRVTTALVVDATPDALRDEAEKAFELVLGHRGHGGFAGLLLGSVALRMAGRAAVPLVIVRDGAAGRGEVVVGYDVAEEPGEALRYAFDAAAARGARLRVVHAWQLCAGMDEPGYALDEERLNDERRARVIEAYAPLRERYPLVGVANDVLVGHPVSELTRASRTADLVVVGAHHHRWGLFRLGSIGHGVIHHAECPVAVVGGPR
ncbi:MULTISPECIES: universal stress protein [Actinomadura]|jgi:nucleotide-binding universal stress UspA family protein|uniref:Nucleotide-binding universal stress UspA family protein n=1 Tax=Actinomadura citrea TaxID=46158 RepID=A0A7Y9GD89_9ACTN|nr:universal stress protein [Actinomadura citrea]NYE13040.1 nucleotide-binding universal stress UspA family protein [Actinomadura citrea]GGT88866.1 universal stress protein [Actinomadura citrea]